MRLKGVLEYSLGNFLCLRGFAPMGTLYKMSEPDPSYQRDLIKEHKQEMIDFLNSGEFTFFPEVILCTTLASDGEETEDVDKFLGNVKQGVSSVRLKFQDMRISCGVYKSRNADDKRSVDIFQTATLELLKNSKRKFFRIDGNHRLSATPESQRFEKYNTPYCIIFFRNFTEQKKLSRALFHNINYKHIPLTMEQNLKLIIDDEENLFPDEKVQKDQSFGWSYYLTRKVFKSLDLDLLPNLKSFFEKEPRTFLVRQFDFLIKRKVLKEEDKAIASFKDALVRVNTHIENNPKLKDSKNPGILASLMFYELQKHPVTKSFTRWILENNLHLVETTNISKELQPDFIQIFDKILESKKHTIFVSMQYGKAETEEHYTTIERVCSEINEKHKLHTPIKPQRVDWFHDGTSYRIDDKIEKMILDCGLFIGDLTFCNMNVYHEIGFVMGKARAEGKDSADMLLILDKSVPDPDKKVGSNISSIKQLRFETTEKFADDLKANIEKFYRLA